MNNCIFCKIVQNHISSNSLYEDKEIKIIKDIYPIAPIHFLIIPKKHIETLTNCNNKHIMLLGKMILLASDMANKYGFEYKISSKGDRIGGYKVICNTGPNAGQEIYHLHFHILSTFKHDK
ncbi:histidine triad nucleotide-binding protein [Candidatus Profftella armatura (Diaphorina cf. continua)]|uniref:Histidine triad nucleotide-binding protein n=1 Tax=Candidatus Profftella armatura (Diaphorina cf. continua) TaxID=2661583 RepID=A0A7R7ABQ7_9PROT|nr:HIT domain-containing protein [Candidatus Profftella armatura (Diaphorina cf. continua)]BCG49576.1 histidine triad nucleotide-binding protein [Candidatus Profftella armatura (Diaphorina cf. continua)]